MLRFFLKTKKIQTKMTSFSKISLTDQKTIFAPSTPLLFSAVSVFRISGRKAKEAFKILKTNIENIVERKAYFTKIFDENNEILDSCLMIFFKGPKSFTGEDIVEIQTHGSPLITKILCEIFSKQKDFSYAENGEFSRRALKNGKMDLVQAEGLLKLIHSQTRSQLSLAHKEFSGEISEIFENIRDSFIEILAITEALIDFPEDDLGDIIEENKSIRKISQIEFLVKENLKKIQKQIENFLSDSEINQKIIDGFEILIFGKPNAGKSSLLNYIHGEEIAIVSDLPGTTRDLLETRLDINGFLVKIIDSAGIRNENSNQKTDDPHQKIEQLGIEKALKTFKKVDLIILLLDSEDFEINNEKIIAKNDSYNFLNQEFILEKISKERVLFVLTKMDENDCKENFQSNIILKNFFIENQKIILISSLKKKGLKLLTTEILNKISEFFPEIPPVIGSNRQREILKQIFESLRRIIKNFEKFEYIEILAEEIRNVVQISASLTETISNEDVLDQLFKKFCIGK